MTEKLRAGSGEQARAAYARLPLLFEEWSAPSGEKSYHARGEKLTVSLSREGAVISVAPGPGRGKGQVILRFSGGRSRTPVPIGPDPAQVYRYVGAGPAAWRTSLPVYRRVELQETYPGIDVVFYGNRREVEFDFNLQPAADPNLVRLALEGADEVRLDAGDLVAKTPAGEIRLKAPTVYQESAGGRRFLHAAYRLLPGGEAGFELGRYDRSRPLVIDPVIVYSTTFGGGTGADSAQAIAVDAAGNAYVAGYTYSADLPAANAFQSGASGGYDGFVFKLDPAGSALLYASYFGGSGNDRLSAIAVDSAGNACVAGFSDSPDFPAVAAAQPLASGGADAVILRLNASGALQSSTFLGGPGADYAWGAALDAQSNCFVAGQTSGSFPTNAQAATTAAQGGFDAFAAKLAPSGVVSYSTLLGGFNDEVAAAISVDSAGNAYIAGTTNSPVIANVPLGGAQELKSAGDDGFVAKLDPTGSRVLYFTYLGGSAGDGARAIVTDASGNAYVGGYTASADFPVAGSPLQAGFGGERDGFLAKLNTTGSLLSWSTHLGAARRDEVNSVALDGSAVLHVTGTTDSRRWPVANAVQPAPPLGGAALSVSQDSGATWQPFDDTLPGTAISLSPDPDAPGTVIVSTAHQIYRTSDGGSTWSRQASFGVTSFSRSPSNPNVLYGSNGGYVYRSNDRGITWLQTAYVACCVSRIAADANDAAVAYLAVAGVGVYRSSDGGAHWNPAAAGLPAYPAIQSLVAATSGVLYAAIANAGVYKSSDRGSSWQLSSNGLPSPFQPATAALSVSPSDPSLVYAASTTRIYRSSDGGSTWLSVAATTPLRPFAGVAASAAIPAQVFAWSLYQFQSSEDRGATWSPRGGAWAAGEPLNLVPAGGVAPRIYSISAPVSNAFVARISATSTAVLSSTLLGGSAGGSGRSIAAGPGGDSMVAGDTFLQGFPQTSTAGLGTASDSQAFVARISAATPACSVRLAPSQVLLYGRAQSASFSVGAPTGCQWSAAVNAPWLRLETPPAGTGTAPILLSVDLNTQNATRAAVLSVGGASASIRQTSAACVYSVSAPDGFVAPAAGGTLRFTLSTSSGCDWAVTNAHPAAITSVVPSSGSGPATVSVAVAPNPGSVVRVFGGIAVGPQTLSISQPAACRVTATASTRTYYSAVGGQGTILVQAASSCPWTVSSLPGWITLLSGNGGSGAGQIQYRVSSNRGLPRNAPLTVAGTSFTIAQQSGPRVDFDGDGRSDLFLYDLAAGDAFVAMSNGDGTLRYRHMGISPTLDVIRMGDWTNDGLSDMILYSSSSAIGYFAAATGAGSFQIGSLFWIPRVTVTGQGDFNRDGRLDVLIYRPVDGTVYIGFGTGGGNFQYYYGLVSVGYTASRFADVNGDGRTDMFFYRASDGLAHLGLTSPEGFPVFISVNLEPGFDRADAGDVNGDGCQDLLLYATATGFTRVILGGSMGLTVKSNYWSPGFTTARLLDFDGDGLSDLALYNKNNTMGYLGMSRGDGTFLFGSLFWGSGMDQTQVLDLNGDGRDDVIFYNNVNGAAYAGLSTGVQADPFRYTYHYWGLAKRLPPW